MKNIIAIILTFCLSLAARAGSFEAAKYFAQGNSAYTNQNYQEAITCYNRSAQEGLSSPALSYNLANAYYKTGDLGNAIAYYRKAELFAPRDADTSANLKRALSQTEDNIARKEVPSALRSFFFLYFYLGLQEQAKLALIFWIILWLVLSVFILSKNESVRSVGKKFALVFLVLTLVFLASACYKYYDATHQGVVTAEEAKIHAGPDASYTEIFVLRSGSEVKVTRSQGSWKKILVNQEEGQSQAGWLEESQIKTIL
jgi:tetratricopeptide (TPR) repeat protein